MCVLNCFSRVQLFATLWTVVRQAPLSTGFSRQKYWSGLPFPSPEDLPDPGIEPISPADALPPEPPGKFNHLQLGGKIFVKWWICFGDIYPDFLLRKLGFFFFFFRLKCLKMSLALKRMRCQEGGPSTYLKQKRPLSSELLLMLQIWQPALAYTDTC